MLYLMGAVIWPLFFVGLYFAYPVAFPDKPPLDTAILFFVGILGMAAFTFAGALRVLGFLRDDQTRREKAREDAANDPPI